MTDTSPQPALDELHGEQKRLAEALIDGLGSYIETYRWLHDVMVYSGGQLSRDVIGVVTIGGRDKLLRHSLQLDEPIHRRARKMLLAQKVMPAFRSGLKELRWKATEYGENPPDADRSEHIVLRPAYDSLASKQKGVMNRGLTAFESRDALLEWVHDAQRASLGELPEDLPNTLAFRDRHALKSFVEGKYTRESSEAAAFTRLLTVGSMILPRFNGALGMQLQRASEQSVEVEEEPTTYELEEELLGDDAADGGG